MKSEEISFSEGVCARAVVAPLEAEAGELLRALGLADPKALVMIAGGAGGMNTEALKSRLARLFGDGIARAAGESGALIIDGGTRSGVMALMGEGVAVEGGISRLLGVAPKSKVTYPGAVDNGGDDVDARTPLDPNHTHFVLVETDEWGGETATMYALAGELGRRVPALTILVNGGHVAVDEVLRSVRQNWPVVVIEGSGRLADEVARLWREKSVSTDDAALAEIINDGDIRLFPANNSAEELRRLLVEELRG